MSLTKTERRKRIRFRIRKSLSGTLSVPRLSVFRSNNEIYVQIIDDQKGFTLLSASSRDKSISKGKNIDVARQVGELIAKKALETNIVSVVFDRGGYLYHGRIKSLADGARKAGLKF